MLQNRCCCGCCDCCCCSSSSPFGSISSPTRYCSSSSLSSLLLWAEEGLGLELGLGFVFGSERRRFERVVVVVVAVGAWW